jgi:hypothetical protein
MRCPCSLGSSLAKGCLVEKEDLEIGTPEDFFLVEIWLAEEVTMIDSVIDQESETPTMLNKTGQQR